jgi:HEPN domain-containing protein
VSVDSEHFDVDRVTAFWLTEAEEALRVADHLVEKGDYSYALFFGHLAIEKLLKALYAARHHDHAPPIHNLVRLAKAAGIDLGESRADSLVTITAFNVEARYPDMKRSFRQMCTAEYAGRQTENIKGIFTWLRSQIR